MVIGVTARISALPGGSRTQQAAAVLTDLITSGQIQAGEFLPSEQELCRQLGVSRATVREALRMLETRGLVTTRHGVGVQVADETHRVVSESIGLLLRRRGVGPADILEVRLILDCQAAALAAPQGDRDRRMLGIGLALALSFKPLRKVLQRRGEQPAQQELPRRRRIS